MFTKMKTMKEKIEVMQAAERGETIEMIGRSLVVSGIIKWTPIGPNENIEWNWEKYEYRVKTKPVEGWINVYPDGTQGGLYNTKKQAQAAGNFPGRRTVKVCEVPE